MVLRIYVRPSYLFLAPTLLCNARGSRSGICGYVREYVANFQNSNCWRLYQSRTSWIVYITQRVWPPHHHRYATLRFISLAEQCHAQIFLAWLSSATHRFFRLAEQCNTKIFQIGWAVPRSDFLAWLTNDTLRFFSLAGQCHTQIFLLNSTQSQVFETPLE